MSCSPRCACAISSTSQKIAARGKQTSIASTAKHLDFVICNKDLAPVVAIELDDASHDAEDREERDDFVDAVLRAGELTARSHSREARLRA